MEDQTESMHMRGDLEKQRSQVKMHARMAAGTYFNLLKWLPPNAVPAPSSSVPKPRSDIPPWSKQDRQLRSLVSPRAWFVLLRANTVVTLLFFAIYVFPEAATMPHDVHLNEVWYIVCFILLHMMVTILKAVPDNATSTEDLNNRTNATTFVAMTLYVSLGLLVLERQKAWDFAGIAKVAVFVQDSDGHYAWGPIFPFLMWGMSALILLRDCYRSVPVDCPGVVSDATGKASTGLFRRYPNLLESFTADAGRLLTVSLWDVLSSTHRPAGGAGRFLFQLIAPVVLLFIYIGYRFTAYAIDQLNHLHKLGWDEIAKDQASPKVLQARLMVWVSMTAYCVLVRGIIPSELFLRLAVRDRRSYEWRRARWMHVVVGSKRSRVLWAFRGLAGAYVPYHYVVVANSPENPSGSGWQFLWYLLVTVRLSFLMEGIGAFFFALHEAEHGCDLHLPFAEITKQCFWGAFNVYLQPFGTVVNLLFHFINGEFRQECVLTEIWGPLLDDQGQFRVKFDLLQVVKPMSEAEMEDNLQDWVSTWKRKRRDVGRDEDGIVLRRVEGTLPPTSAPQIFRGTVFPTKHEWFLMRDHHKEHVVLKPWETFFGAEKFLQWYPTYQEEVLSLLRVPYNFRVHREVWVFGYGSLLSPDSPPAGLTPRQQKLLIPYWLRKEAGYQRVWNFRHGHCGINAVGLFSVRDADKEQCGDDICGCVYPMDYEFASDLFSKREDGYELLLAHEDFFEPMHPDYRMPRGVGYVWACGQPVAKCSDPEAPCADPKCKRHWPTDDSPILQSYVDEILTGALRYKTGTAGFADGMNFAGAIIATTRGWDRPWWNDRLLPGRPWKFSAEYELIDGLLATCPTSRVAFLDRLRVGLARLTTQRALLERECEQRRAWADDFYGAPVPSPTTSGHAGTTPAVPQHASA